MPLPGVSNSPSLPSLRRLLGALALGMIAGVGTALAPAPSLAAESVLAALVKAAKQAPPEAEGIEKIYDETVLKPDALRACLVTAREIDVSGVVLDRERTAIDEIDKEIDETGQSLKNESEGKFFEQRKVDAFNARVDTYNARVEERIQRVRAYNIAIEDYMKLADKFEGTCNGKSYYPSDLAAVTPQLAPEIQDAIK